METYYSYLFIDGEGGFQWHSYLKKYKPSEVPRAISLKNVVACFVTKIRKYTIMNYANNEASGLPVSQPEFVVLLNELREAINVNYDYGHNIYDQVNRIKNIREETKGQQSAEPPKENCIVDCLKNLIYSLQESNRLLCNSKDGLYSLVG